MNEFGLTFLLPLLLTFAPAIVAYVLFGGGFWTIVLALLVGEGLRRPYQGWLQRRAARQISASLGGMAQGREFGPVQASDFFPPLSEAFYRESQAELERLGFVLVGDGQDLTAKVLHPEQTVFFRLMVTADRSTAAVVAQIKLAGIASWAMWLSGRSDVRFIEFETELDANHHINTNASGQSNPFDQPPWTQVEALPPTTPIPALYARHQERVEEALAQSGPLPPQPLPTHLEGMLEEMRKASAREAAWRAKVGVSSAELDRTLALDPNAPPSVRTHLERELQDGRVSPAPSETSPAEPRSGVKPQSRD